MSDSASQLILWVLRLSETVPIWSLYLVAVGFVAALTALPISALYCFYRIGISLYRIGTNLYHICADLYRIGVGLYRSGIKRWHQLKLKRRRALVSIWIAPIRKDYLKLDPRFRGLKNPLAWLPRQSGRSNPGHCDREYGIHLFPDNLRLHFFYTGMIWLLSLQIMAALSERNIQRNGFVPIHDVFAGWLKSLHGAPFSFLFSDLIYLLAPSALIFATICLADILRERYRAIWPKAHADTAMALYICVMAIVFLTIAILCHREIPLWLVLGLGGFFVFWLLAPFIIYVWRRRPVWENVDDQIPELAIPNVHHSFQEHIIPELNQRSLGAAFLKRLVLPLDGDREPIYWRNSVSNQEQMINVSLSIFVMNAMVARKSGWSVYALFFFFGPSLLFYFGLWVIAASGLFNPVLLGLLSLAWALVSIRHTMHCFNIVYKKRWHTGVPFSSPTATNAAKEYLMFERQFTDFMTSNGRISTVINSVHFICSVLLIAFISFADLAK